ncbi:DUF1223 domain-containing protein [Palleronia sp. LCG004]|uniref:DUF1223 domain-containing protein n=1 Tax=Palleronia sp. LCG004 TaxID=3079304 RepID=UPI0029432FF3|nr:DUF1223 domain-containing protein [Palleronia sp. LCG004]WOI54845.1 DUF1223 domain-containing protein [Palleronia sp. LCG004]
MRFPTLSSLLLSLCLPAAVAQAGDQPVVIELFTSQGCSACPPADELVRRFAEHDDVLPLALHVDYWDYIGWADEFADPAYTRRQKGYARAAGQRSIYTPQMVIEGVDHVVGYKPIQVMELVQKHRARPDLIPLDVVRSDGDLRVRAEPSDNVEGPVVVQLVRYVPERVVEIDRGENAGHTFAYANIVSEWRVLGSWSGEESLDIEVALGEGEGETAIILQRPDHGEIVATARVE